MKKNVGMCINRRKIRTSNITTQYQIVGTTQKGGYLDRNTKVIEEFSPTKICSYVLVS